MIRLGNGDTLAERIEKYVNGEFDGETCSTDEMRDRLGLEVEE